MNAVTQIPFPELLDPLRRAVPDTWPITLPIELALRLQTPQEICAAYGIDEARWDRLRAHPVFMAEVKRAVDALAKEGMRFKTKAGLLAEDLLDLAYKMANDKTINDSVRADMIKWTARVAGLEPEKGANINVGVGFSISMDLSR